jgi:PAB1-binding protein PBP1
MAPVTPPAPVPVAPPEPPVEPEPVMTPQQQRQSIEESIAGIKEMMNSSTEGMSPEEIQEQNKAWKELLEVLEAEKKNLEQNSGNPPQEASDKEEAAKDSAGKNEKK